MRSAAQLWLAGPEAADHLDDGRLDEPDRRRAARLAGQRKEAEWRASRALRQAVAVPAGAPTSLSHSAGYAALAVGSPGCRIGVDLEAVRPRDVRRLARFCYSHDEARRLEGLANDRALQEFYVCWTLKEACAKALGLPLLTALRQCRFLKEGDRWCGSVTHGGRWEATVWQPRPELVLSVVVFDQAVAEARWQCREWPGVPGNWPVLATLATSPRGR